MDEKPITFDAFISYRHKPLDMAVAKAIHKQIETYRIPGTIRKKTGQKKMGKVFRDQDELPLLADLGEGIRHALEQSKWLIVICSPDLPLSKWCLTEIDYFISLGRQDHILTVLVAGDPEESFPTQLRIINGDEREPLAADVRAANQAATLRRIKREKLRLLAPMLGVGYDDLRRRQRERVMRTALTAGAIAFTAMAGSTAYVLRQNSLLATQIVLTEEQRQVAEEQRQIAVANEEWAIQEKNEALVSQSKFLSGISTEQMALGDPMRAALLALEALPADPANPDRPLVAEAEAALRIANISERQSGFSLVSGVSSLYEGTFEYLETLDILLVVRSESVELFRGLSGQSLLTIPLDNTKKYGIDETSGQLATLVKRGTAYSARIYDLATLESREFPLHEGMQFTLTFAPGGKHLMVSNTGTVSDYLSIYNADTGEMLWLQDSVALYADVPTPDESFFGLNITSAAISPDGRYIAFGASGMYRLEEPVTPVRVLDLETGEKIAECGTPSTLYHPAWFPDGERLLLTRTADYVLETWMPDAAAPLAVLGEDAEFSYGFCRDFLFSPDGLYLAAVTYDDGIRLYDAQTLETAVTPQSEWHFAQIGFTGAHTLVFRDSTLAGGIVLYTIGEERVEPLVVPGGLYQTSINLGLYTLYQPVFLTTENFIITFSGQNMFHFWRKDSGQGYLSFDEAEYTLRGFSGDGTRYFLSDGTHVFIRDAETSVVLHSLPFENCVSVLWSPDGSQILLCARNGLVELWDLAAEKAVSSIPPAYTSSPFTVHMSVSADWTHLILSSPAHTDGLYTLPSLEKVTDFIHLRSESSSDPTFLQLLTNAVFLPDGQRVCIPYGGEICVIDLATLDVTGRYAYAVSDELYHSPDRTKLAFFTTAADSELYVLTVLEAETGALLWQQAAHSKVFGKPIVWSADGRRIATSHGAIAETKVWDAVTGLLLRTFALERPSFSPDGLRLSGELASAGATHIQLQGNERGEIYDIETGRLYMRLPNGGLYNPQQEQVLMLTGLWSPESLTDAMHTARTRLHGRALSNQEREIFFLD